MNAEQERCLIEAKMIAAVDEYIKARPQMDTIYNRRIYEAGYKRSAEDQAKSRVALQARIDALMLEFCPEDMAEEQVKVWGENQRPCSKEMEKKIEDALRTNSIDIKP